MLHLYEVFNFIFVIFLPELFLAVQASFFSFKNKINYELYSHFSTAGLYVRQDGLTPRSDTSARSVHYSAVAPFFLAVAIFLANMCFMYVLSVQWVSPLDGDSRETTTR